MAKTLYCKWILQNLPKTSSLCSTGAELLSKRHTSTHKPSDVDINSKSHQIGGLQHESLVLWSYGVSDLSPRPPLREDILHENVYFNNTRPQLCWCLTGRKRRGGCGVHLCSFFSLHFSPLFPCTHILSVSCLSTLSTHPAELFCTLSLYTLKAWKHRHIYPQSLSPSRADADSSAESWWCANLNTTGKTSPIRDGWRAQVCILPDGEHYATDSSASGHLYEQHISLSLYRTRSSTVCFSG